jgi:predicted MFS family arabinose efflux permease
VLSQTGGLRRVLAHRELRLLFGGSLVSLVGSWSYSVALLAYVFAHTHSYTAVGVASLARFVPAFVFSAYGGVIAERRERVGLMVRADVTSTGLQAALAIVAAAGGPVWLAVALAGVTSTVNVVYGPATAALLPQLAGEDDLVAANALDGLIQNLVVAVGPALGAVMVAVSSPAVAFAVNAASFAVSALLISRLGVRSRPTDVTEQGAAGPARQMLVGLQAVVSSRASRVLVALSVLASLIYGVDTVLLVGVSEQQLGTGARGFGYLLAGLGVGGVLMAGAVNRLAASRRLAAIICAAMGLYCLPTALLVAIHSPALAFLTEIVRGAGTLVVDVLAITALQRAVAPDLVARVFGVFFALVLAAISLGALITAPLITLTGLHATLYLFAIVPTLLGFTAYPALARLDRENAGRLAELEPRIDLLKRLGIFATATRPVLERLAATAGPIAAVAGETIIREGEPADALYALVDGTAVVTANMPSGEPERLRSLGPDSYFGEIGVLEQIPRTATVTALTDCELYRIDADAFRQALTEIPPATTFLDVARARLARTHPTHQPSFTTPGSDQDPARERPPESST